MTWKKRFERAMAGSDSHPGFQPGLDEAAARVLENKLGVPLPAPLRELLRASNGVHSVLRIEGEEIVSGWLIWPSKIIARESPKLAKKVARHHRQALVFFAPGDVVDFAVDPSGRVLAWEPIEAELRTVAKTLETFVTRWCSGKLEV